MRFLHVDTQHLSLATTPPLLLLIMLMTNNRKIMGDRVNSRRLNILGWITTAAIFAASIGLVATWFL